jgi:hypothetical protein
MRTGGVIRMQPAMAHKPQRTTGGGSGTQAQSSVTVYVDDSLGDGL